MSADIERRMDDYRAWLRDKTALRQVGDWTEITTPNLDRHNDYLQIYVRSENGGYLLTDGGHTLQDLKDSGCSLESPKRQELLHMTLRGFGVELSAGALQTRATPNSFALRKHSLIQAILSVDDMFYLATPMVNSLFFEDVVAWMDMHDIRYTARVKLAGRAGLDHNFDFVIPKSKAHPERIMRAINRPNREAAQMFVFAWIDTREARPADARAYALLNDSEQYPQPAVLETLKTYDVRPIYWSHREDVRAELAA